MLSSIHVDVGVPALMALEMHLQISLGREAISTDVTFKWPLSCMRPDVDLKGAVAAKDLVAKSAFVTEKRIICTELGVKN